MPNSQMVSLLRTKFMIINPELDERGRRRWAAMEACSIGWGGVAAVAMATGLSDRTIRNGILEISQPDELGDRQRRPGAGRKRRESENPEILTALNLLVEPDTRGDPMTPLRWTCKSTRTLATELNAQGFVISSVKVGELLKLQGYSLQSNRKTVEGKQHPDRDAQFKFIANRVRTFRRRREPAISIDTKKKETLGNLKNAGKTYRRKGEPVKVKTHDFPDKELGKAVPMESTTSLSTKRVSRSESVRIPQSSPLRQ